MPASKLRLRSGFSDGLSVNAISNASGGRMPGAGGGADLGLDAVDWSTGNQAPAIFGLTETTRLSPSNAGAD